MDPKQRWPWRSETEARVEETGTLAAAYLSKGLHMLAGALILTAALAVAHVADFDLSDTAAGATGGLTSTLWIFGVWSVLRARSFTRSGPPQTR